MPFEILLSSSFEKGRRRTWTTTFSVLDGAAEEDLEEEKLFISEVKVVLLPDLFKDDFFYLLDRVFSIEESDGTCLLVDGLLFI